MGYIIFTYKLSLPQIIFRLKIVLNHTYFFAKSKSKPKIGL